MIRSRGARARSRVDVASHLAQTEGHMAHTAAAAPPGRHAPEPLGGDVARFHRFLHEGPPGPHAYAVLLGLDVFDTPELLRSIRKGFPYRTLERFQRNTSLALDRITEAGAGRTSLSILRQ